MFPSRLSICLVKLGSRKRLVNAFIGLMLAFACAPSATRAQEAWKLENDRLVVTLSSKTGGIQSVVRKGGGETYTNAASPPEVSRVQIPLSFWDGHSASSSQAVAVRVREQTSTSITLEAGEFVTSEGKFSIQAELRYRLEGDNVVAGLRLTNKSANEIDRVAFPILEVSPAADGNETLTYSSGPSRLRDLFSRNKIKTRHDPFLRLDPTDQGAWFFSDPEFTAKAYRYPMALPGLPTTWMAYRAGGAGIGWDIHDRTFQTQRAMVERKLVRDTVSQEANRQTYELFWLWHPWIRPGESWESPEVFLKFDEGDWHKVAKQHREWLKTWMRRPQIPVGFQSSLGWISRGITSFDSIPAMAKRGVDVGAPYFIVYGWYCGTMGTLSYDYFPRPELGGVESLRKNLKAARALGAYPLAWFNGTTSVETMLEHQEWGRNWIAVDRLGGMSLDGRWTLYGPDRPPTFDDSAVNFNFDMGTGARDFLKEMARRMVVDYGFSGFENDQGSKNYLSFSRNSDFPQPNLSYSRGLTEFYEYAADIVKKHDPNGIIVGEGISDLMNQYVDSSWIFEGGGPLNLQWQTIVRYSLPWMVTPARAIIGNRGVANLAFMLNAPLDFYEEVEPGSEFEGHLKKLHKLKQAVYPYLYGGDFSDTEGFALRPAAPPSVQAKSYLEKGRTTVVVVNSSDRSQIVGVDFVAQSAGGKLKHYRLDGQSEEITGGPKADLQLGPYDVQVLVFEEGGEANQ